MDRLRNIADLETEKRFLDESPQNSPRPQASSTFMVKGNDSDCEKSRDKKPESSMTIFSTTSSLGVIDIDKESLFSEKDFSSPWSPPQSTPSHQRLIDEYKSQSISQLKKRLDELSFRNSSFNGTHNISTHTNETYNVSSNTLEDKIRRSSNAMRISMNSSSGHLISSSPSQNGEFESGNMVLLKLEEDQKENRKMFSSLPVSPMNFSESSENVEEKEQRFNEFIQAKCYSPDEISNILRNKINNTHREVIARLFEDKDNKIEDQQAISSSTDARQTTNATSTFSISQPQPQSSNSGNRNIDEYLPKASFMDVSSINTSLDISSTNSIASLNEIAEILKRQSLLAKPKLAVEELLSLGRTKQKTPSIRNSNFSSGETTLINTSMASRGKVPSCENILSSTMQNINANEIIPQRESFIQHLNTNPFHDEDLASKYSPTPDETKRSFFIKLPPHITADTFDKTHDHLPRDFVDLNAPPNGPPTQYTDFTSNDHRHKPNNSIVASPVQRISSNHSLLNDTTGNDNDTIFAGNLCVGTLAEVIVVVENPTKETLRYKTCLKSITNDNPTSGHPIASVMLASNREDITFLPQVETEINLMITPLVEGKITLTLELISEDNKCSNIIRRIEIISEMPKLKILQPESGLVQFGSLNENTLKSVPLVFQNQASSKLPLKLMLYEDNRPNPSYHKLVLNPFEKLGCEMCVSAPPVTSVTNDTLYLQGKLIILIDTPESVAVKIPLIRTLLLSARVIKTILVVENESPLVLKCNSLTNPVTDYLNVRNVSMVPLDIYVDVERSFEFTVEPKYFKLFPRDRKTIEINFKPNTINKSRDTNIHLIVKNMNKRIPVKVVGIIEQDNIGLSSNTSTPPKSRNQSYKSLASSGSSSGSSVAYDGIMELDSTHSSLSWASVPLNTRKIQTFTLRNRGSVKEKLLLMISDAHNFYKFIENELCVKELRLTLESKESRKISVAFTPTIADQPINGKITLVRRNTLESSVSDFQKRVIPLFGVGGSVKMLFSGVFHDNEDRLWINCDSHSFETKFIIENVGDAEAFVKIVSEELDDKISPEECTLLPSESVEIDYVLHLNTDRLDMLYKQHSHKEVMLVNKLIIYSGNESTRLRLKRIWSKNQEYEKNQKIRDKMEILNFDSNTRLRIDSILDAESIFTKFLYEGITEHAIGVLVPRQNLENVSLDSTVIFRDLNNFTFENVFNS